MKLPASPPKQTRFLRSQQDMKAKFEQQQAQGEQSDGMFDRVDNCFFDALIDVNEIKSCGEALSFSPFLIRR